MKKRFLSMFLALVMMVTVLPSMKLSVSAEELEVCLDNINYKLYSSDNHAEVVGVKDKKSLLNVIIPERVKEGDIEYPVTAIEKEAFRDCLNLIDITIPESVKTIGAAAFSGCTRLKDITIPNSVTKIEKWTFHYCLELTEVKTSNNVIEIEPYAFMGCEKLTDFKIPERVTEIGKNAFCGCEGLTSVTIPRGVTKIKDNTFSDCGLTNIIIPGVTEIEASVFMGCINLESVVILGEIKGISERAFEGCKNLDQIEIENSKNLQNVDKTSFTGCDKLKISIISDLDVLGAFDLGCKFRGEEVLIRRSSGVRII